MFSIFAHLKFGLFNYLLLENRVAKLNRSSRKSKLESEVIKFIIQMYSQLNFEGIHKMLLHFEHLSNNVYGTPVINILFLTIFNSQDHL